MTQYLLAMFFTLICVSSQAMEPAVIELTLQDKIKGKISIQYTHKVTDIYKKLLDVTSQELAKDTLNTRQKKYLKSNLEGLQESLDQIETKPFLVYALLQEGNRLWIEEQQTPKKNSDLDFYFSATKKEYEQLHDMYVITRNKAYEHISTQQASQTKTLLSQLRILYRKNLRCTFSKKARKAIIKKIEGLEKLEQAITELPSTTYLVLERLYTLKGNTQSSLLKTDSSYNVILNRLHALYEFVIKSGFFE